MQCLDTFHWAVCTEKMRQGQHICTYVHTVSYSHTYNTLHGTEKRDNEVTNLRRTKVRKGKVEKEGRFA